MTEDRWDTPIVELSHPMCRWIYWLTTRDLAQWTDDRRTRLSREEATAFAMYLADHLQPEDTTTEVPPLPPLLRAG